MTDQATDGIQNMNIQDYQGSEFDPFSPQQGKMANIQSNGGTDVDLLGDSVDPEIPNGHDKFVSFDPGQQEPLYSDQDQDREKVQRHMSTGEILGYQNEYGETNITGQMEYEGYSDEEYGESGGNVVDYGNPSNGPPLLPNPKTDQDYYMSTGQPLVDFGGSENVAHGGHYMGQAPMGDQFIQNTGEYSSQGYGQEGRIGQDTSDIRERYPSAQQDYMDDYCDNDETDPSSWAPEMDAERARRSLSPERSVSPRDITSQSGADVISSPQYDTDSYGDTGDISSPSEMIQHPTQSDPHSFIPASEIPGSPARAISSPQPSITESESSIVDSKGSPKHKIPRPKKKKPIELPPWDDNVVIPPLPRMKPTMIGKNADLPPPSSPQRPRTAPSFFTRKDASSDSGVEDDKTAKSPRKSSGESKLKRYGVDAKNQAYKPGGGNVAIFSEKVEMKTVGSRTDSTRPRSAMSPHGSTSSVKSPSSPKPPSPNTKSVQSKIGSLNNVKHKPGGGDVTVLSSKTDFSSVKSKVGSKDKMDHKPKGGEKKIEVQKLAWKAESKVGSLKNATHSPGGGNVKDGWSDVPATMNTRENVHYMPQGGHIPGPYEEDLDWDTEARVNTFDNVDYVPGGGSVKVQNQRLTWSAQSRVGSLENAHHTPGGGKVKVLQYQPVVVSATPRVGSLTNTHYTPRGGHVVILDQKVEIKAQSKVGSTANLKHKPGGGDKKIETQKLEFTDKAKSKVGSMDKVKHKPGGGDVKVFNETLTWSPESKVQSLANIKHKPGGGDVQVIDEKVAWTASARVGSLDNAKHVPGGGQVQILDEKVEFTEKVKPKVGSMDKIKHQPGGGDKKIETQKLTFKETAKSRTDTGGGGEKEKSRSQSRADSISSSQDGSTQE